MKQVIFCALLIIIGLTAVAQTKPNEDSLINLMKDDLCAEMGKTPVSEYTAENFQMKMGMQMLGVFDKYNSELKQLYGEDYITNQSKTYDIGKKIGMQMGMSCKVFQEILMNNPDMMNAAVSKTYKEKKITEAPKEKVLDAPKQPTWGFTGKVVSFTPGEISFYSVNVNNQVKKVYWLGKFEGDDQLIANPKKIIGKQAFFRLTESKIYSSTEKVYKKISVIVFFESEPAEEIIEDQVIEVPVKN